MQHPDETLVNIRIKHLKTLETYDCNMYMQYLDLLFATSRKNTCNIRLDQMKHTLETYVYSHYNMRNIPIYFRNIDVQHLQHTSKTSETLETYYYNMRFQRNICLLVGRMEARRHGARSRGVAWRLPVWSSSVAQTSAQGQADGARPQPEA